MSHGRAVQPAPALEELEARAVLAAPTVAEQVFLERLNDARANPSAYGASLGLDLSRAAPAPPLAFDPRLIDAARGHSKDMSDRGYFSHTGSDGSTPGQRARAAGFAWTGWAESIAAGYDTPEQSLAALIIDAGVPDLGHRRHLLALDGGPRTHRLVGVGIVENGRGPYGDYVTVDSASEASGSPYLTGVVYSDRNRNGRYDAGEGIGGVTVTVAGVGSVTTWATGGYTIRITPGTYRVTTSGGPWGGATSQTVSVGSANVRLNVIPGAVTTTDYVTRLYQRVLGRTPSAAEANSWAVFGQQHGPAAVALGIERSREARTALVRDWYETFLGRSARAGEEGYWVEQLVAGASEEQVLTSLLSSVEYRSRAARANGGGDAGFVRGLYRQLLGRDGSASEVAAWVSRLPALGAVGVVASFVRSVEYRSWQVKAGYTRLLRRSANANEAQSWAASPLDLTGLRIALETSAEFINR